MPTASSAAKPGAVGALYVPTFDGIRGFVTLSIALIHVQLATGWSPGAEVWQAFRGAWFFSVEFLFVLGGFVAFLPLALHGRFGGWRPYAVRRAGRILPLYYLTLALGLALGPVLRPVSGTDFPHDAPAVLAHAVFLQQEVYPFQAGFGVQGIVWTMSIAGAFYVLFPLIATAYLRRPFVGLAVAVAVSVVWRLSMDGRPEAFLQFPLFAADFAVGMYAAHVYVRLCQNDRSRPRPSTGLAIFAAALATLGALLYATGLPIARGESTYWAEGVALSLLVPAVFAVVLVSAPFIPGWGQRPLANPVSRWLGEIGYGIFLVHFLVIWSVLAVVDIPRDGSAASLAQLMALAIPLTLFFGWLGTAVVERPLRLRAHRLAERWRREDQRSSGVIAAAPVSATAE
jgi:peptidoglycan/LPS O-acetylase OafA/YrhL